MKTIEDIVAEMRKDMPRVIDAKVILRNYADRIEAAHKREIEDVNTIIAEDRKTVIRPLRNCDVGTAEEQVARQRKWCVAKRDFSCDSTMCRKCFADWSQMPCEEVKE